MLLRVKSHTAAALAALLLFVSVAPSSFAQKKSKKPKPTPRGTPVLWRNTDPSRLDLSAGPGGPGMRPATRRLRFLKEEKGGWSKKFRVRDSNGREWIAKLGKESQSETAAVRLVWAAGYVTEINYLVPRVTIPGKGTFENVRFELRPKGGVKRLDEWSWKQNPFSGTRELEGLKVLMVMLNNWDLKDVNNVVIYAPGGRGGGELRYVISDLGATLGKTGGGGPLWRLTRSRNNPEDFADSKFIDKVEDGYVNFHFTGVNKGLFEKVRVDHARWIGKRLSRLTDGQLHAIFRAANYTPDETRLLARVIRGRINELVNLPGVAARR
ncbi:MAG TPA: hypothetical protein VGP08_12670 [Pyrinomonadaceae bacterium]|jgi:hypothetical protein|nr:hypothetical protein [Pyrinomonadaceae bacterium]